jgi:hypothetical protein
VSQQTTNQSLDELARALANGSISRGKALKLMGAALVGGTLASLGIREAVAAPPCRPVGKHCKNASRCCSERCVNGTCAAVTFSSIDCRCADNSILGIGCAPADCSMADAVCNIQCQDRGGGVPISCVPPNPGFCE